LGLESEVIAITKFCTHPNEWFNTKWRIGGTKTVNIQKIKALQPQLIIANKEENTREQVEELAEYFPVWVSDVNTLEDALHMIDAVGNVTGKEAAAEELSFQIQNRFSTIGLQINVTALQDNPNSPATNYKPAVAYFIWKDPYMTVGGDTFISNMLEHAGFKNVFKDQKRYPVVTINDLETANCPLLFLSSEPYPFRQKHIDELQAKLPGTKIMIVDGEAFSWYGSRLLYAPAYFKELHGQVNAMTKFVSTWNNKRRSNLLEKNLFPCQQRVTILLKNTRPRNCFTGFLQRPE
jgi:ABC-type Fe3+-hydroxamate transport system substrate-binding protein